MGPEEERPGAGGRWGEADDGVGVAEGGEGASDGHEEGEEEEGEVVEG